MDNQKQSRYLTPEMKIVSFNDEDIVRTSYREGTANDFNGTYGDIFGSVWE